MSLDVLMIGHGAIARYAVKQFAEDGGLSICYALCRPGRDDAAREALGQSVQVYNAVEAVPGSVDVAVDCAGHGGLRAHGPALLRRGIDLITVSNGALADAALAVELESAAKEGGAQLRLLPGAIGAIDAIAAAKTGGLDTVRYTGRKPPKGWAGSPAEDVLDLEDVTEPATHFEGTAREAALRYPKNANVAATVALAGIGLDKTEARLIADPTIATNQHSIDASGTFGRLSFTIEGNALPGNPRSSALTAMSVVRALRALRDPLVV